MVTYIYQYTYSLSYIIYNTCILIIIIWYSRCRLYRDDRTAQRLYGMNKAIYYCIFIFFFIYFPFDDNIRVPHLCRIIITVTLLTALHYIVTHTTFFWLRAYTVYIMAGIVVYYENCSRRRCVPVLRCRSQQCGRTFFLQFF